MRSVEKKERVERGREKKKGKKEKGGKGVLGNCGCFWFLIDCVFSLHPFLSPLFQSTMPPHSITTLSLTPTTVHTTPHHGTHNTPHNHACVLWCLLFACRCLCVSLSARSFLTQHKTTPRHPIPLSTTHGTTNA